ncbi:MAG: DUF938 domain-containing protein [Pseudomonadota bacterium]
MTARLPPSASTAHARDGAQLHAPAASRNQAAICEVLKRHAPTKGIALEIASGTGQHAQAFAAALPGLFWQPSDIDPARRASIDSYRDSAGLLNLAPAIALDATRPGWGAEHRPKTLVVLINLLHLITSDAAQTVIAETAYALATGGIFMLYGPFRRSGTLISPGDQRFDAELRAADPDIGYKDAQDIAAWMSQTNLELMHQLDMPANNIAFIASKPA